MKNLISLILVVVFVQTLSAQNVDLGVRLGPSLTTFGGGDAKGSEFRVAFQAGIFLGFKLSGNWSLEPGAMFARKGSQNKDFGTKMAVRNDYLDLPFLFKYKTEEEPFYIFFGPQPSFLLNSVLILGEGSNKRTLNSGSIMNRWNGFDFAAVIGFGAHITDKFGVQFSYEHGLANISKTDNLFNRGIKVNFTQRFY